MPISSCLLLYEPKICPKYTLLAPIFTKLRARFALRAPSGPSDLQRPTAIALPVVCGMNLYFQDYRYSSGACLHVAFLSLEGNYM